jgi:RND family efflux transporter MFP subunit
MPEDSKAAQADLNALRIDRDRPRAGGGWIIGLVLAIVAIIAGYFAWRQFAGSKPVPEVLTAPVRRLDPSATGAILSAGGYLLPATKANVTSKTFGKIVWIGFAEGQAVKKDQVIARLESADVVARLEEAKAGLLDAEREFARWKKAVDDGVEPRERLDKADTTLSLAKARVKTVEAELEYTNIRAPFDGVVVKKSAEVGENIGAGGSGSAATSGSLCTIIDPASMEMVADVNETNISKIKLEMKVEVVADALPGRRVSGKVRQIMPTADRAKGVVQVKVALLEPEPAFLPEMAARATFHRDAAPTGPKRVMAPKGAVRERDGRKYVLVVDAGRAKSVTVEAGPESDDGSEITSGLVGGEIVIVGGEIVEDGAEVRAKGT